MVRLSKAAQESNARGAAQGAEVVGDATGIFASLPTRADITSAIKRAATATGANFEYLLATAKMESNLAPDAAASTSSAKGLFQFIDQTWLGTVKEAGAQHGYGRYADAIERTEDGDYEVEDPAMLREILKLRDDPVASSAMAGVLTQSNSFKLSSEIGRRPSDSELYMAHFMGVGGASRLINAVAETPQASGALMFPKAAAANRSIFFDKEGNARSVAGVYSVLTSRYAIAANSQATQSAGRGTPVAALDSASALGLSVPGSPAVSISAPVRAATATPVAPEVNEPPPPPTTFRSLYQLGPRTQPVASTVRELWNNQKPNGAQPQPASQQPEVRRPQPLDLFSDRTGQFAG